MNGVKNRALSDRDLAKYIVFQRTDLGVISSSRFLKKRCHYNQLVELDSRLFSKRIVQRYRGVMSDEWKSIATLLPNKINNILDIGCGIAGIHEYSFQNRAEDGQWSLTLLDRDAIEPNVFYDFRKQAAAYNSLDCAERYLTDRGVPRECLRLVNVESDAPPLDKQYDLIISLLSWGFHYPVETYLDYVEKVLSPQGSMIIDARNKPGNMESLSERFTVKVIHEGRSHKRVLCQHKR